jgi:hypothetical protein
VLGAMSTTHIALTLVGGVFDLTGLVLVAAADVWPQARSMAATVWIAIARALGP